jgi:transposase
MKIEFLPPYSPDFNPIELCFSGLKAWLKRHRQEAEGAWADKKQPHLARLFLIQMALEVSREHAYGWFDKCGVLD